VTDSQKTSTTSTSTATQEEHFNEADAEENGDSVFDHSLDYWVDRDALGGVNQSREKEPSERPISPNLLALKDPMVWSRDQFGLDFSESDEESGIGAWTLAKLRQSTPDEEEQAEVHHARKARTIFVEAGKDPAKAFRRKRKQPAFRTPQFQSMPSQGSVTKADLYAGQRPS
jgi:hypothetical protein